MPNPPLRSSRPSWWKRSLSRRTLQIGSAFFLIKGLAWLLVTWLAWQGLG